MSQVDGTDGSEPTAAELGDLIKTVMDERGRKREWLASEADVSLSKLNRIFKGDAEPSYIEMVRIATALHKPLAFFAGIDPDHGGNQLDAEIRAMLTAHRTQLDRMQNDLDRVLGKAS